MKATNKVFLTIVVGVICVITVLLLLGNNENNEQPVRDGVDSGIRKSLPADIPENLNSSSKKQRNPLDGSAASLIDKEIQNVGKQAENLTDPQTMRIRSFISALEGETFEELVNKLNSEEGFTFPGAHSPKKLPQIDIEHVFSNRRTLRLLDILRDMLREEASEECNGIFQKMFEEHKSTITAALRKYEDPDAPRNQRSLLGNKWGLCSAIVLSTFFCDGETVKNQIKNVEEYEQELHKKLSDTTIYSNLTRAAMRNYSFLQNAFKLNIFICLALKESDQQTSAKQEFLEHIQKFRSKEIVLTAWDANVTWYDFPHRIEGVPIDISKGAEKIKIYEYEWGSDTEHNPTKQEKEIEGVKQFLPKIQ